MLFFHQSVECGDDEFENVYNSIIHVTSLEKQINIQISHMNASTGRVHLYGYTPYTVYGYPQFKTTIPAFVHLHVSRRARNKKLLATRTYE